MTDLFDLLDRPDGYLKEISDDELLESARNLRRYWERIVLGRFNELEDIIYRRREAESVRELYSRTEAVRDAVSIAVTFADVVNGELRRRGIEFTEQEGVYGT